MKMKKRKSSAWAVLTKEEELRLFESTAAAQDGQAERDCALIGVALAAGLRVSEVAALRVGDVIGSDGAVKPIVKLPFAKGGSTDPAHFGEGLRQRLGEWIETLTASAVAAGRSVAELPLWPSSGTRTGRHGAIAVRTIQAMFKRRVAAAGIDRRIRFHDARHTAISRAATASGGNIPLIAKFARHSDIRTTMRYIHADPEAVMALADKLA